MTRTTLQIPLDTSLRDRAEKAALASGFSSVQEIFRVFLNKLATQAIDVGFYQKKVQLSKGAEKRYATMIMDAKNDKDTVIPDSFDELISLLE